MATARRVAAETRDIDNSLYHPADVGARRYHPAMSGGLVPLPARVLPAAPGAGLAVLAGELLGRCGRSCR